MRLDYYLVKRKYFSSRGRAKHAIIEGHVKVNGTVVTKPSFDVTYADEVKVAKGMDKPAGYWKLKEIQERSDIIKQGDKVLDIGSSAGGFLLFASEIASHVHGIEFSREFESQLERIAKERDNVTIEYGDAFNITLQENYDVLLFDITSPPSSAIQAIKNVLPALRSGGRALLVFKLIEKENIEQLIKNLYHMGLEITETIKPEKQELYLIARKHDRNRCRENYQNHKK